VNDTFTTPPTVPAATVTWPRYVPGDRFEELAEMARIAGVVPVAGDTESQPPVGPRYRAEAANVTFCPVVLSATDCVAVADPAGAVRFTCCGKSVRLV
jgi:hypothetical protein